MEFEVISRKAYNKEKLEEFSNFAEKYAYVQMLNFSMPIVKTQVYDEGEYADNNLSVKNVVLEALGIRGINPYNIVGKEIGLFSNIIGDSSIVSSIS